MVYCRGRVHDGLNVRKSAPAMDGMCILWFQVPEYLFTEQTHANDDTK